MLMPNHCNYPPANLHFASPTSWEVGVKPSLEPWWRTNCCNGSHKISGIAGCPPSPPRRRSTNGLYMNTIQAQLRDQLRRAQQFVPHQGFRCLRSCPNTPANDGVSNAGSDTYQHKMGYRPLFWMNSTLPEIPQWRILRRNPRLPTNGQQM